jgi:hypothetical protein
MAFAAPSVVPASILNGILSYVAEVFVMGEEVWEAAIPSLAGDRRLLAHTAVIIIYKDQSGAVQSRALALSTPPTRMWGFDLLGCPRCSAHHRDMRAEVGPSLSQVFHDKARFFCTVCRGRTGWIARPDWVNPLGSKHPQVFWYEFPVPPAAISKLQATLSESTSRVEEEA